MGLALAVAVGVGLSLAPLPLEPKAHRLAGVFGAVVLLWVTEALPIPVTALLIAPLLVVTGVAGPKEAFAPYADPLLFLFVGGFFIAAAMARHGLDVRMASRLVSAPWVAGRPARVRVAFMVTAALLSMWISNTATTAILAPILLGTFERDDPRATGSLLAVAYAASLGGLGTIVGSPPNLITARFLQDVTGEPFGFVAWLSVGFPVAVGLLVLAYFVSARLAPPGATVSIAPPPSTAPARAWSRGEKATMTAFALAVLGWSAPELLAAAGVPGGEALSRALPGGVVALFASVVLFVARDERGDLVLPWREAAGIDWGIIMLFGGGISLGHQMFETGLAEVIARGVVGATGLESALALIALLTVFTIFFTEVCSNTASANMIVPIAIAISVEIGVSPMGPALAVGLAASCAFMLPIATGPNAIVFGTGRVPQHTMMRHGLVMNLCCAAALIAFAALVS